MNINPSKSCLRSSSSDLPTNTTTGKKVSFDEIVTVKNTQTIFNETDEKKSLTISLIKKTPLLDQKMTREFISAPAGSFLKLKERLKDFFEKPVMNRITTFELYQKILQENNPSMYKGLIESVLVSQENGGSCIFKEMAETAQYQEKLLSLQETAIPEDTQLKFQVLHELCECKILDVTVKEINSQESVDNIRERVLSSDGNQRLFIQQFVTFLDNLSLLKAVVES